MKFFAKLLAFIVVCTFIGAVWFTVAGSIESEIKTKESDQLTSVDYQEVKYENVNMPAQFMGAVQNVVGIRTVKPASLEEFKKQIYLESRVIVLMDNAKLKNPFLGVSDKLLIQPIGFNETHIITTGREVGQDQFKYVAEEFWTALMESGRKVWVVE